MKKIVLIGAMATFLICWSSTPLFSQEMVVNNGFEMKTSLYHAYVGNVSSSNWGVDLKYVTSPSVTSWSFWQSPSSGKSGGPTQTVFVESGVTYDFSADIAYYNC